MMSTGLIRSASSMEEPLSFSGSRPLFAPHSLIGRKITLLHALQSCARTMLVQFIPANMDINNFVFIGAPKWRFQVK